jgi:hypothetical protein
MRDLVFGFCFVSSIIRIFVIEENVHQRENVYLKAGESISWSYYFNPTFLWPKLSGFLEGEIVLQNLKLGTSNFLDRIYGILKTWTFGPLTYPPQKF